MKFKAAILDIDGTLVSYNRHSPTQKTLETVEKMQQNGFLVMIATGRSSFVADHNVVGFYADYTVCANGAYAIKKTGQHLFDERLSFDQTQRIINFCDETDSALGLTFSDANYVYNKYEWYAQFYRSMLGNMCYVENGESRKQHFKELPFTAFSYVDDSLMAEFCIKNRDLIATPYASGVYDIYRREINKATGIAKLLDLIDIKSSELVAIGDGENDIEMLQMAGMGVAMGNSSKHVKSCADMVAKSVDEDGAALAMEQLFSL
ncbi:MAG: HAD family hydrolase [Oscillospiraceae bacterium]